MAEVNRATSETVPLRASDLLRLLRAGDALRRAGQSRDGRDDAPAGDAGDDFVHSVESGDAPGAVMRPALAGAVPENPGGGGGPAGGLGGGPFGNEHSIIPDLEEPLE